MNKKMTKGEALSILRDVEKVLVDRIAEIGPEAPVMVEQEVLLAIVLAAQAALCGEMKE